MIQKKPTTHLGKCTTVANWDSHYKGYNRNQAVSKFTNTRTSTTTQNPSICYPHSKHCMIHHLDKETEAKWGNGCPPKGKWRYEYTIQYHRSPNAVSQISPNIHLCLHYIGLHQGWPHIHETSPHTHNGLCGCSYDLYTITRYTPYGRTRNHAHTHWSATTLNNALTHIIR